MAPQDRKNRVSFFGNVMASGSSEKWRRRSSVRQQQAEIKNPNLDATFSTDIFVLLIINLVIASRLAPFSASVSVTVLAASVGYAFLKDNKEVSKILSYKSRNKSFTSEVLVFILRRAFTAKPFQEALRMGLCRIRAGEDYRPGSVQWPSDIVIRRIEKSQMESILKNLVTYPKTRDLDPLVCFLGMSLAQRKQAYFDDIPLVQPVTADEDFVYTTTSVLDVNVPWGYMCAECGTKTKIGQFLFKLATRVTLWLFEKLELFEETRSPLIFDSVEEAAVFFHYIIRPYMPRSSRRIAYVNEAKDVHGDASAHAFAGVGAWRLKAIVQQEKSNKGSMCWAKREASVACVPPEGSVAVIDCSWQASMKVRPGYETYGAAAFFNKDKELVGIWNEAAKHMVLPSADDENDEPWRWAQYHWKSSIAYEIFSVGHLLEIHWSASNTLVQTARYLPLSHPIRRIIKPFTWGSAFINYQALVNLVQTSGVIVRTGAVSIDGLTSHFEHIMDEHVHYGSFEKFVTNMGIFPTGFIEDVPLVEDGRSLWTIFESFVDEYMSVFFEDREDSEDGFLPRVEDDPDLLIFWEQARTARTEKHPLELEELSFSNLREFLTWGFFWSCAVHNLVANFTTENTLPTSFAGRIESAVRNNSPESGFQVPINTWLTQLSVLALTTIDSVPFLIESIRDTADFYGPSSLAPYGRNEEARMAFLRFADRLDELSVEIDKRNETRGWLATNCFNPKVLLCSASL